ncbi:MAG: DegQ family serine endoprotease [Methylocapsa sp.]|nr:DegQ family serine endoprotease [Methylocapsa sp.]
MSTLAPRLLLALPALLVAAQIVAPACAFADTVRQVPSSQAGETLLSYAPVVRKAEPAVVNVYASRTEPRPQSPFFDDPIFRRFFGDGGRPGGPTARSLGSGVLVDSSGLVVTNFHVVQGMTNVKVALSDKREFDAAIILRDQRTDLAVLKLRGGDGFPVMELGDSDVLEVGDLVLAIGNPFAVGQTVTQGIISALARTQVGITDYGFFIQTDAAINPGNSGGALVDMRGKLIGINSAIYSQTGSSIGIGFAIPVNMVKSVIAAAKRGRHSVRRPWLGASLQIVSHEIADSLGLERPAGALVADISAGGPAAEAGLRRGDLITAIDGQAVEDPEALGYRLATKPLGGTATFAFLRDGKPSSTTIRLVPAPEIPPRDPIRLTGDSPFSGMTVVNVSPAVSEELSIRGASEGVAVSDIQEGSKAAMVNFQKGDVILAINDDPVRSTRELEMAARIPHDVWKLTIRRGGETITTMIGG